jgi:protein O-GlcNAc transferase
MAEIFELHDRSHFKIFAYAYDTDESCAMRERLESAFDNFFDISDFTYEQAAKKIYDDHVDILVDLTGHTQNNRCGILALRPAPIQASYLGYPGTMGADFFDYLIADYFTIPAEMSQHYTEKIARMPGCFQANDSTRPRPASPTRTDCGLPNEAIVFCCFNQTLKITPEIFDIWCRILTAVPGSILWIPASNPQVEENLRQEAKIRGVTSRQLVMAPLLPREEHLARMQCADLFLDTLPYNAGTTCSDALWMGLPVITCAGDSFVSRMAGSLLMSIGAPELITYNLDDYYHLAIDLATDRQKLEAIRNKITLNRDAAPLFDSTLFTRNLEKMYIQMMDNYLQ